MPAEPHTLRRRLLTWLLLPLLILFFLRVAYSYYYATELANRVFDRMLYTLTSSLSEQITYNTTNRRIELRQAAYQLLMEDDLDTLYFAIRDPQGKLLDGEKNMPQVPSDIGLQEKHFFSSRINNKIVRIATLPITIGRETYTLQVAETLNKRTLLSREFLGGTLYPQALIIILTTIIVWIGIGKSLVPLKRLQKSVSERSHLDLSPLHEADNLAEVQPLIHSINDLMARLSDVLEAQNRFVADAAHQLRTPLAGLKTQIELALRQNDPTMTSQAIQSLLVSTDRMTRLVNQLLVLARNEPKAESVITKLPIDIGSLALNATMEWVPRALEKNIDLGFEAPDEKTVIQGDASRIKDLIDNLIDNAVRYTPRNGQITVSVKNDNPSQLVVTDNGPGIPVEQRERVFERFYSVLGNGADGSGLGLAIVREIAHMHGAKIFIESAPTDTGTRVSVVF